MSTCHANAAETHFYKLASTSPLAVEIAAASMGRLRSRSFGWAGDVIYQPHFGYDLPQALTAAEVWAMLVSGAVAHAPIGGRGIGPSRDSDIAENQAAIDAELYGTPFRASIDPGRGSGADDDGDLWWDESVTLHANGEDVVVPPGCVPLEVGSTNASKTLWHLRQSGGVARWPYGSKYVWLLIVGDGERKRFIDAMGVMG